MSDGMYVCVAVNISKKPFISALVTDSSCICLLFCMCSSSSGEEINSATLSSSVCS